MGLALESLRQKLSLERDVNERIELQNTLLTTLLASDWHEAEREALAILEEWHQKENDRGIAVAQMILARIRRIRGQMQEAIELATEALYAAEMTGDRKLQCQILAMLADIHRIHGEYSAAIRIANDIIEILDGEEPALHSKALYLLAQVYIRLSDFKTALKYAQDGLKMAQVSSESNSVVINMHTVAEIHGYLEDFSRAIPTMLEALRLSHEIGHQSSVINCLGSLCNLHLQQHEWSKALVYALEVTQVALDHGSHEAVTRSHLSLAIVYQELDQLDLAATHVEHAFALSQSSNDRYCYRIALSIASNLWHKKGKIVEAMRSAKEALSLFDGNEDITNKTQVLEFLVQLCENSINFEEALQYQKQLAEAKLFQLQQQNHRELVLMQVQLDSALMQQERDSYKIQAIQVVDAFERQSKDLSALASQLEQRKRLLLKLREELGILEQNTLSSEVQAMRRRIDTEIRAEATIEKVEEMYEKVQVEFASRLTSAHPELSKAEVRVCLLLKSELRTPDISRLLHTSERTVENHRLHIRKKLKLNSSVSLHDYLTNLHSRRDA